MFKKRKKALAKQVIQVRMGTLSRRIREWLATWLEIRRRLAGWGFESLVLRLLGISPTGKITRQKARQSSDCRVFFHRIWIPVSLFCKIAKNSSRFPCKTCAFQYNIPCGSVLSSVDKMAHSGKINNSVFLIPELFFIGVRVCGSDILFCGRQIVASFT